MQPDSLRGTPLFKYSGLGETSVCACSHTFAYHEMRGYNGRPAEYAACRYCSCIAFTQSTGEDRTRMADAAKKAAEQNGVELGRKYAAVFAVRGDATYEAKVELGMYFAGREGLSLENGAAFVTGFVNGISSSGKRAAGQLTLEEKLEKFLENELDKRLSSGVDPNRDSGSAVSAD